MARRGWASTRKHRWARPSVWWTDARSDEKISSKKFLRIKRIFNYFILILQIIRLFKLSAGEFKVGEK
jgi:hypothetical protein